MAKKLNTELTDKVEEAFYFIGTASLKDLVLTLGVSGFDLIPVIDELLSAGTIEREITSHGTLVFKSRTVQEDQEAEFAKTLDRLMAVADQLEDFTTSSLYKAQVDPVETKQTVVKAVMALKAQQRIKVVATRTFMKRSYEVFKVV